MKTRAWVGFEQDIVHYNLVTPILVITPYQERKEPIDEDRIPSRIKDILDHLTLEIRI